MSAVKVLGRVYTVEESVSKIAESPRDLRELYSLEVWLTEAATKLRDETIPD